MIGVLGSLERELVKERTALKRQASRANGYEVRAAEEGGRRQPHRHRAADEDRRSCGQGYRPVPRREPGHVVPVPRRCPVGAIPNHRSEHRGIVKAKLKTKRCLPLMMQTSGCSICMKSLPGATLRAGGGSQRISTQRLNPGKGHRRPRRFRLAARRAPLRTERKATCQPQWCGHQDSISTQPAPSPQPTAPEPMVSSAACSSSIHRKSTPASTTHGIRSYITWFITM